MDVQVLGWLGSLARSGQYRTDRALGGLMKVFALLQLLPSRSKWAMYLHQRATHQLLQFSRAGFCGPISYSSSSEILKLDSRSCSRFFSRMNFFMAYFFHIRSWGAGPIFGSGH